MSSSKKLYHIGVCEGDLPKRVLLPGSRKRVLKIGDLIGGEILADERQLVLVGSYKGKEVAVVDTGMGPSSAAIIIREVIWSLKGEGVLIRVGTCGSLQPLVKVGDLVIPEGVVADECVSKKIVGEGIPLMPSREVVDSLKEEASKAGYTIGENLHIGITHTKDALYEFEKPELSSDPNSTCRRMSMLTEMGVLATEMELSVLLALALKSNAEGGNIRAGGLLLVVSPYIEKGLTFERPSQEDLIKIALEAVIHL